MSTTETLPARPQDLCDTWGPIVTGHLARLAENLIELFSSPGCTGFTLDPLTLRGLPTYAAVVRDGVYVVSIRGFERKSDRTPSVDLLREWLVSSYEVLCVGGNYIGYWQDRGVHYLDVSRVIHGRDRALAFARSQRQDSIYHPSSGSPIKVDYPNIGDEGCNADASSPVSLPTAGTLAAIGAE